MRVIRDPEVTKKVGLSTRQINRLVRQGRFPARVKLCERASGFIEAEIDAWIDALVVARQQRGGEGKV